MKTLITALCIFLLAACTSTRKAAYEVIAEDNTKILKGTINRQVLESDPAFPWFSENLKGQANAEAVEIFKNNASQFTMVVFGGTWCSDTRNLLPVFYRLVDKSGYPDKQITLIGVDRQKTAPNDLHKTYNISQVPTFIVFKNGKEVGRVVEYGKDGQIDKELGEIVAAAQK